VSLKVIAGFIQFRIGVKHHWRPIVCGIKNIKVTIHIGLDQNANMIAFVKNM